MRRPELAPSTCSFKSPFTGVSAAFSRIEPASLGASRMSSAPTPGPQRPVASSQRPWAHSLPGPLSEALLHCPDGMIAVDSCIGAPNTV